MRSLFEAAIWALLWIVLYPMAFMVGLIRLRKANGVWALEWAITKREDLHCETYEMLAWDFHSFKKFGYENFWYDGPNRVLFLGWVTFHLCSGKT